MNNQYEIILTLDPSLIINRGKLRIGDVKPECVACGSKAVSYKLLSNNRIQLLDKWEELLTIDHIIPTSKGGLDKKENLQLLCRPCNVLKDNKVINIGRFKQYAIINRKIYDDQKQLNIDKLKFDSMKMNMGKNVLVKLINKKITLYRTCFVYAYKHLQKIDITKIGVQNYIKIVEDKKHLDKNALAFPFQIKTIVANYKINTEYYHYDGKTLTWIPSKTIAKIH